MLAMKLTLTGIVVTLCLFTASPSQAQLVAAKDAPVAYGHHHLNVTDIPANLKFFGDALGGTPITVAGRQMIKFPNVLVFLRQQKPTGGSKGSSVDHLGFSAPDLRVAVDKIKANGYRMVTKEEAAAPWVVTDDIASQAGRDTRIAFAMGPDDLKVEIVEVKGQQAPVSLHHVHFAGPDNKAMQEWYAKVFGAKPGNPGATFQTAALPGVALNFNQAPAGVAGTQGRVVDHVGFEITGLPEFLKKVEAMGIKPVNVRDVPDLGASIAFITDPWGTYIELTEGLKKIQ
jgi:catechol 2,3-dioxygenase-like lactoylglutathione lyase family enzyme